MFHHVSPTICSPGLNALAVIEALEAALCVQLRIVLLEFRCPFKIFKIQNLWNSADSADSHWISQEAHPGFSKTTPRVCLLGSSEGGSAATGAAVTIAAGSAAGICDSAVSTALSDLSAAVSLWFAPLKAVGLSHSANLDQWKSLGSCLDYTHIYTYYTQNWACHVILLDTYVNTELLACWNWFVVPPHTGSGRQSRQVRQRKFHLHSELSGWSRDWEPSIGSRAHHPRVSLSIAVLLTVWVQDSNFG